MNLFAILSATGTVVTVVVVILIFLVLLFLASYVKAAPDTALIISGFGKLFCELAKNITPF